MHNFIGWLYSTALSQILQKVTWIIPAIQSIHIICLSILFTSMLMLDFRLIGIAGRRHSVEYYSRRFLPWLWRVLPVLLFTGLLLVIAEPNRDLKNAAFYLKMTLLIVVCVLMYLFQRSLIRDPARWEPSHGHRRSGQVLGAACLLMWVGIVVSGRLIAYV